jgi:WD40 repeat protein/predicted Ser/Thr protein kinase
VENQVGRVIKSYELEGLIGMGGFGAVYRARQSIVEREVAIKIIWPAFANHPNFIRNFEAEAQLVAGLEHPYIVPLYDYWRDPEGAYIVMRWLRGGHLRQLIDQGALPLERVSHLLENISAALALAHRYGVVHRDLKPENILLDEEGNAYLADFGIAQILSKSGNKRDDMSGMGSPAYAAPEQLAGSLTSSQSDIYSLGILLFEMLTGQHPFPEIAEMSMTELLHTRQITPLPLITSLRPDLSPRLDEVLQRATAFDPKMRYSDALSLTHDFQQVTGSGIRLMPNSAKPAEHVEILNPYKGLRAFQEVDALNFFGREALTQRLMRRLGEDKPYARFLAVVGPSGSGKSSVVRAGLIPELRRGALAGSERWFYDQFSPGAHPFNELETVLNGLAAQPPQDLAQRLRATPQGFATLLNECLPDPTSELLLFIDQFEELFTQAQDPQEFETFLLSLYHAVAQPHSRLRLIVAIRADFYDRPLLQPFISDLVRDRTEVVIPLSPSELERAIVEPARRVNVDFESGLVTAIINEVKEQPGALPLLQYALSELFELREGLQISPLAYKELGGVRGALARRADAIYQQFDAPQREAMRQLFLRLITLGEGTEDTRRRALLSEVSAIRDGDQSLEAMRSVIDGLGKARLLTFDRDPITRSPTLEVAHEAIIREWTRLRNWLDDSRNDVRQQRTLASLAHEWQKARQDPSYLMLGGRLQELERWAKETPLFLTDEEKNYLNVSVQERLRTEAAERQQQEREARLKRQSILRLRLLVVVLALAMLGALGLTGFAFNERSRAEIAAQSANQNAAISQSVAFEASARNALAEGDGDLALALALLAVETVGSNEASTQSLASLATVALARGTRAVLSGHNGWVTSVDISPDQRLLASGSTDASVRLWDATTGVQLQVLSGHNGDINTIEFSPDGTLLATAASDFNVIVWNVATGEEQIRLAGHNAPVRAASFSSDAQQIYSIASSDVFVWDVATGELLKQINGQSASLISVASAPNQAWVATGSRDGSLSLWDVTTGERLREFVGHRSAIAELEFSEDGLQLLSGADDGVIILWDSQTGAEIRRFVSTSIEIRGLAFLNSSLISAGGADGILRIWDVNTGVEVDRLRGHADALLSLSVSRDKRLAVTGAKDNQLRLWNIGNAGEMMAYTGHTNRVSALAFTADAQRFYSASADGSVRLWALDGIGQNAELMRFDYAEPVSSLALSPDEKSLLLGGRNGRLWLADAQTGAELRTFADDGHTATIVQARFLQQGRQALSLDSEGVLLLWQVSDAQVIRRFEAVQTTVYDFALSPDEQALAIASADGQISVLDLSTGVINRQLDGHDAAVYRLSMSADGRLLASVGRDGIVMVWDWHTGREVARLVGTNISVLWSVDFSPSDGGSRYLAVGSTDGRISVWDLRDQTVIQRFYLPSQPIFALRYALDGRSLISGDSQMLYAWRTFSDDLLEWTLSHRYRRELTCIERIQYRAQPYCS